MIVRGVPGNLGAILKGKNCGPVFLGLVAIVVE